MQYGLDIERYKRIEDEVKRKLNLKEESLRLIAIMISTFLFSRVVLYIGIGDVKGIAPFGIGYLIALVMRKDLKEIIVASIMTLAGYITINESIGSFGSYVVIIIFISIISVVATKFNYVLKEKWLLLITTMINFVLGIFISNYSIGINLISTILSLLIIAPIYYITRYGINSIANVKTEHFFSTEEIISISIVLCLCVSGIGGANILGFTIKNMIAIFLIVSIAFIGGPAYGSAIGVSMGVIIGITTGNMMMYISYFSVIGLMIGVFKEMGKTMATIAAVIMYLALSIYSKDFSVYTTIELIIGSVWFMFIPKEFLKDVENEFDSSAKAEVINTERFNDIKEEFASRVEKLGEAIKTISKALESIGSNDKLLHKGRSAALVENVADRVCTECKRCKLCWDREFNQTYNSFLTMISSTETSEFVFPESLQGKCDKKLKLKKGAEEAVKNLNLKEMKKGRLEEGRRLLANHVDNVSKNLDKLVVEFKGHISLCLESEKNIRKVLNKAKIEYEDILCYIDKDSRVRIKIKFKDFVQGRYYSRATVENINTVMDNLMRINEEASRIDPIIGVYNVIVEESPKYHLVSYGASAIKDGEEYSGDYYTFGKVSSGNYITVVSDGMGSGPEAGKESRITVELIESFIECGFDEVSAIDTVNSIIGMKFEEDEKFTTLDLNVVDTYNGTANFIKVGGTSSFIKRGNKVKVINSEVPPFGLVDNVEAEEIKFDLKEGDMIITVSDGVIDIDKGKVGEYMWLQDYLEHGSKDPKVMAEDILSTAKNLSRGKIKDDMTIVVSKVYAMY